MVADDERRRDGEEEIGKKSRKRLGRGRKNLAGRRGGDRRIWRDNEEKNNRGKNKRIEQKGKAGGETRGRSREGKGRSQ